MFKFRKVAFYMFCERDQGIWLDGAYGFLLNRWLEKRLQAKPREENDLPAEPSEGNNESAAKGLLEKKERKTECNQTLTRDARQQLTDFYEAIAEDARIGVTHIGLYFAFLHERISRRTYNKCIQQLQQ